MKKVLSLAVAAALAAPAIAMADSTIYGKVRVSEDKGGWEWGDDLKGLGDGDWWGTNDHASRLGIKGSEDLGNGLSAIYQMEFGVKVGESFSSMSGRNAFVGLAGDFGTFLIGRHDTPMKISTGKLDLFGDTVGDYNNYGLISDLRIDGAIAYVSPSFSGLTFAVANVSSPLGSEDFSDALSGAVMYSNGPIYLSGAFETHQTSVDPNLGVSISGFLGESGADKQFRFGAGLMDWNGFTATLVYEKRDGVGMTDNINDGWDSDAYVLNGGFKLTPNDQIKAMYGNLSGDDANSGANGKVDIDQWSLGYQHNLSARTDVQVVYTAASTEFKDTVVNAGGTDYAVSKGAYDEDILSFQLNHKF